jgi:uncharacterized surface protein with fasciclin (FAS1) repeats
MTRWKIDRRVAVGTALSVSLLAAACSSEGSASSPAADGGAAAPFGVACAQVPGEGDGSFEAMMTAPVADAASANPLLSSLVMDLELAGLYDTVNNAEALTVFAPTNDAFEAAAEADPDGMAEMMADPTGDFAGLLSYHVVEGQLEPDQLAGTHTTLEGSDLTVEGEGESFTVNGSATVVCGGIHTDNATVYLIDEVLHP